jgi:hypothetical protein
MGSFAMSVVLIDTEQRAAEDVAAESPRRCGAGGMLGSHWPAGGLRGMGGG